MPIKIQKDLPARSILEEENIFVMDEERAVTQDIRPLQILIVNLMPLKEDTETQLLRALSNTPLQLDLTFLVMETHESKNTSQSHINKFYVGFSDIKNKTYDGMIITGAPVENLEYEEVGYFEELANIMKWSKLHVTSTLHICWASQVGLYYHYGIKKHKLEEKLSGIYKHKILDRKVPLVRSLDDYVYCPHSRNTEVRRKDIEKVDDLLILAESEEAGVLLLASKDGKQVFMQGHPEYDRMTLAIEYDRDMKKGLKPNLPKNYFENDDTSKTPVLTWRNFSNTFYTNWLNFYVYQNTPYILEEHDENYIDYQI